MVCEYVVPFLFFLSDGLTAYLDSVDRMVFDRVISFKEDADDMIPYVSVTPDAPIAPLDLYMSIAEEYIDDDGDIVSSCMVSS